MSGEKKKWYQTGEFEDGYQFGDVFRTIKNSINAKKKNNVVNTKNSKQERNVSKKNGYFQRGALESGNIGAAVKGTDRDVKTDVGSGVLGIGEKFLDWIASVAEADTEARMRQARNDAIVHNAIWGGDKTEEEIFAEYENMIRENKEQTANFIAGDLYDERDIANKIVAGSYAPKRALKNKNFSIDGLKNAYKEEKDYIDNDMENDSVLAEKSDALAETTGHYIGQVVLSKVGVPWYLTAYTTGAGGEIENALKNGATLEEANISGMFSGGGEVASELIFGGPLSKTGLDDIAAKKIGSQFTSTFMKSLAKFGVKSVGEGVEEPVSSGIARLGQWLAYQDDKTLKEMLWSEEAREEYIDAFVGGVFFGSMGQGYEAVKSKYNGVDYVTGLTENEQKVFENKYKKSIDDAKVKNGGKELNGKEKRQIYNNTVNEIKSGQVSAQIVEEALGGEEYSAYKNAVGNYNALQQKLDEIQSIDSKLKTKEQSVKEIEIKQRLEQVKLQADKLKNILENKVAEKIDTDNIHLKDRESYILDSYIKGLKKPINSNLNDNVSLKNINEDGFIEGLWDDGKRQSEIQDSEIVEKSQLESVENIDKNGIIEKNKSSSIGVYTTTIGWSIFKKLPARPEGAGYFTKKIKQHNPRVEAYEIKINPNKEGYHVKHPDGRYVQFENMKDGILQDGKLVMSARSFYFVYDKGDFAKRRVLNQAIRQMEVANSVGYKVEWLISNEKAVEQISRLFKENNINIIVKFYPE